MILPLIIAGAAGAAALGAYLNSWLSDDHDAWRDADVFNARMREMQQTALVLQDALARCPAFMNDKNQVQSWRVARDGFSKFYGDVGKVWMDPSDEVIAQAKDYATRFYQWAGQYDRYKCGTPLSAYDKPIQPPSPDPDPHHAWMDHPAAPWLAGAGALVALGFVLGHRGPGYYRNPRRRPARRKRSYVRRRV